LVGGGCGTEGEGIAEGSGRGGGEGLDVQSIVVQAVEAIAVDGARHGIESPWLYTLWTAIAME